MSSGRKGMRTKDRLPVSRVDACLKLTSAGDWQLRSHWAGWSGFSVYWYRAIRAEKQGSKHWPWLAHTLRVHHRLLCQACCLVRCQTCSVQDGGVVLSLPNDRWQHTKSLPITLNALIEATASARGEKSTEIPSSGTSLCSSHSCPSKHIQM